MGTSTGLINIKNLNLPYVSDKHFWKLTRHYGSYSLELRRKIFPGFSVLENYHVFSFYSVNVEDTVEYTAKLVVEQYEKDQRIKQLLKN